jgi:hypothetical protein
MSTAARLLALLCVFLAGRGGDSYDPRPIHASSPGVRFSVASLSLADGARLQTWAESAPSNAISVTSAGRPAGWPGPTFLASPDRVRFGGPSSSSRSSLTVGNDDLINVIPHAERQFRIHFRTGQDVASEQFLWEEGGPTNGFAISIHSGALYVTPYIANLIVGGRSLRFSGLSPATDYVLLYDYNSVAGSSALAIDGTKVDELPATPPMIQHGGTIGLGGVRSSTRSFDGAVVDCMTTPTNATTCSDFDFGGDIFDFIVANGPCENRVGLGCSSFCSGTSGLCSLDANNDTYCAMGGVVGGCAAACSCFEYDQLCTCQTTGVVTTGRPAVSSTTAVPSTSSSPTSGTAGTPPSKVDDTNNDSGGGSIGVIVGAVVGGLVLLLLLVVAAVIFSRRRKRERSQSDSVVASPAVVRSPTDYAALPGGSTSSGGVESNYGAVELSLSGGQSDGASPGAYGGYANVNAVVSSAEGESPQSSGYANLPNPADDSSANDNSYANVNTFVARYG